jgi:choline dehydrogenase
VYGAVGPLHHGFYSGTKTAGELIGGWTLRRSVKRKLPGEECMNQTGTNMSNTNGELANRIHANQEKIAAGLGGQFDFVVCGAGSSGSVIAGRLAADPDVRVLLLEAGDSDEVEQVMDPNLWASTLGSELDWGFVAEPNPHLNGRAIPYSMGKVLGGGSSINVCAWSRGHQANWDGYAAEAADPG